VFGASFESKVPATVKAQSPRSQRHEVADLPIVPAQECRRGEQAGPNSLDLIQIFRFDHQCGSQGEEPARLRRQSRDVVRWAIGTYEIATLDDFDHSRDSADPLHHRDGHGRAAAHSHIRDQEIPACGSDRSSEAGVHALQQPDQHERDGDRQRRENGARWLAPDACPDQGKQLHAADSTQRPGQMSRRRAHELGRRSHECEPAIRHPAAS
jgi:hypothetical protein